MNEQYSAMRSNVSMLGKLLGDTIKEALGEHILDRVETIRKLSKSSRAGNEAHRQELLSTLQNLSNDELLPVARAFSQFLNLTNVAEQYHSISPNGEAASNPEALAQLFTRLKDKKLSTKELQNAVSQLSIELVLTAHPTDAQRRSIFEKIFALERLHPTDNFNVIRFDNTMEQVFPQAVPANWENIGTALEFARGLDAEGGTEMLPALVAALRDGNADDTSRVRQIVFLTDGAIGNEAQLFEAIHRGMGRSRLFPVGIGSAPNTYFMSRAARAGRGTFTHIGDVSEVAGAMDALFTALERPVMTDLDALFPEGALSEIWPAPLPDLYYGEPVLMTARLDNPAGSMRLEGRMGETLWQEDLSLSAARPANGIATLWARNRIRTIEELRYQGASAERIDAEVLQTALDFHLVSRLTSLVAVDVTPARPADEALAAREVPLMVPHGWDFEAVMNRNPGPQHRAALDPALIDRLAPGTPPAAGDARAREGLALPATATPREWLILLGLLLALTGLAWRIVQRRQSAC